MPIIGVSTREDVGSRFKSLGKLKKGAPKGEGLRDLEYFRFDPRDNDAALLKVFAEAYGEEPTSLEPVYLPHRTMDENFSSWRELYGQNGLCKVRCNGSEWVDWIEGNAHRHGLHPCDKPYKDTANRCPECPLKPVGRLEIILPKLWYAGYIGLVTLETHSWNDIATIAGKLVQWEPLQGRPFVLWREDTRIGVPIKDRRSAVEKSLIKLELTDERLIEMLESSQKRAALVDRNPVPIDGPEWERYADLEVGLTEPLDVDTIDEITAEYPTRVINELTGEVIGYANGEGQAVFNDDQNEKQNQRIGKDTSALTVDLDFVPDFSDWEPGKEWGRFRALARVRLGFNHDKHIKNTLAQVVNDDEKAQLTYASAWSRLADHQKSKAEA